MEAPESDLGARAAQAVSARHPSLRLLVLFGSRARDEGGQGSDWDFAYLADRGLDPLALRADLVERLGTDQLDLADLERAGGLLRFRAARDGRVLFEREPEAFARFWMDAVRFWCDAQPVVAAAYEDVLARLPR